MALDRFDKVEAALSVAPGDLTEEGALHRHRAFRAAITPLLDVAFRVLRRLGVQDGEIDDAQLAWLREVLATPAPLGTIVALHHPPLPSHIPFFDILELRDQPRLAAVLQGTDVRAILAGHLHHSTSGLFAGIPVSVAAATCYTMDLARPAVEVNGMDAGQSFQLVHVYDDTITHAVVPVVSAEVATGFDAAWVERMARLTPEERLEAFSRKPVR